jgi:hypothetical protein
MDSNPASTPPLFAAVGLRCVRGDFGPLHQLSIK